MNLHLPPHLEQRLELLSQQLGKSEQIVLEEMLEKVLPALPKYKRTSIGMGKSRLGNLSERVDELLFAPTKRGSIPEFKKLLDRVPNITPMAGAELES